MTSDLAFAVGGVMFGGPWDGSSFAGLGHHYPDEICMGGFHKLTVGGEEVHLAPHGEGKYKVEDFYFKDDASGDAVSFDVFAEMSNEERAGLRRLGGPSGPILMRINYRWIPTTSD
jgi:hypothetical protein